MCILNRFLCANQLRGSQDCNGFYVLLLAKIQMKLNLVWNICGRVVDSFAKLYSTTATCLSASCSILAVAQENAARGRCRATALFTAHEAAARGLSSTVSTYRSSCSVTDTSSSSTCTVLGHIRVHDCLSNATLARPWYATVQPVVYGSSSSLLPMLCVLRSTKHACSATHQASYCTASGNSSTVHDAPHVVGSSDCSVHHPATNGNCHYMSLRYCQPASHSSSSSSLGSTHGGSPQGDCSTLQSTTSVQPATTGHYNGYPLLKYTVLQSTTAKLTLQCSGIAELHYTASAAHQGSSNGVTQPSSSAARHCHGSPTLRPSGSAVQQDSGSDDLPQRDRKWCRQVEDAIVRGQLKDISSEQFVRLLSGLAKQKHKTRPEVRTWFEQQILGGLLDDSGGQVWADVFWAFKTLYWKKSAELVAHADHVVLQGGFKSATPNAWGDFLMYRSRTTSASSPVTLCKYVANEIKTGKMDDGSPSDWCKILAAFAEFQYINEQVCHKCVEGMLSRPCDVAPRDVARGLWALAVLNSREPARTLVHGLLRLDDKARSSMHLDSGQSKLVSDTAVRHDGVLADSPDTMTFALPGITVSGSNSSLVTAITADGSNPSLFTALISGMSAQDASNSLWAMAVLDLINDYPQFVNQLVNHANDGLNASSFRGLDVSQLAQFYLAYCVSANGKFLKAGRNKVNLHGKSDDVSPREAAAQDVHEVAEAHMMDIISISQQHLNHQARSDARGLFENDTPEVQAAVPNGAQAHGVLHGTDTSLCIEWSKGGGLQGASGPELCELNAGLVNAGLRQLSKRPSTVSPVHVQIYKLLIGLIDEGKHCGIKSVAIEQPVIELWGAVTVDVLVEMEGGRKVAIEIDGHDHFAINDKGHKLGKTALRDRLLAGVYGMENVVSISSVKFNHKALANETDKEQDDVNLACLRAALGLT